MKKSENRAVLKAKAITLRKQGNSYPMIERSLCVNRSTLSGWLSSLRLSEKAKAILLKRKKNNMIIVRQRALKALQATYAMKRKIITDEVSDILSSLNFDSATKESLLVMLYLAEGFKIRSSIGLGNSNHKILAIFVSLLRELYDIEDKKLRCFLHLRADQKSEDEQIFWSTKLSIPISQFRKSQIDKRTIGKATWKNYHGVCSVYCYDARVEKRLTAFQAQLVNKLLKTENPRACSSDG